MKGKVRIGGAVGAGTLIVLSALFVRNQNSTAEGAVVVQASPRTYIETKDANKDGVEDWKSNLKNSVFETITAPTSSSSSSTLSAYLPPTTFTGKFSEAFLSDYLSGKMQGKDFSNPTEMVQNAVTAIDKNTQSKQHTRSELHIVETTPETLMAYGNKIAYTIQSDSIQNENEAVILQRALKANDPKILEDLAPIAGVYEHMIADSLDAMVPKDVVDEHIALLNAYEAILYDIRAMQVAFSDPLLSLARVRNYQKDAQSFYDALKAIVTVLSDKGIQYKYDSTTGSFFYFSEI